MFACLIFVSELITLKWMSFRDLQEEKFATYAFSGMAIISRCSFETRKDTRRNHALLGGPLKMTILGSGGGRQREEGEIEGAGERKKS